MEQHISDASFDALADRVLARIEGRLAAQMPTPGQEPHPAPSHPQPATPDAPATATSQLHSAPCALHPLVDAAVADMAGKHNTTQSFFVSASSCVTSAISAKTKEQIWAKSFVDFSELLTPKVQQRRSSAEQRSSLTATEQKDVKPEQLSIQSWSLAWNRFTAVLTQQEPTLSPLLAHHYEVVMKIHAKRGNWSFYDSEFRQLVARGEAQWGSTHLELFLHALLL